MKLYPPWGMIGPHAIAWWALRTQIARLRVDGRENVPRTGAVMLVARHYHHLLDGSVLIRAIRRPVHIVVGLDWADSRSRRAVEWACRAAGFPIVLRTATLGTHDGFRRSELLGYTRSALRSVVALLRASRVVLVFPEGYPNVDPVFAQKADAEFLPFSDGYRRMIAAAERDGRTRVALVPVGFSYTHDDGDRWHVVARIGSVLADTSVAAVETAIKRLCDEPAEIPKRPGSKEPSHSGADRI